MHFNLLQLPGVPVILHLQQRHDMTRPATHVFKKDEFCRKKRYDYCTSNYFTKYKYVWLTGHSAWPFFYLAGTVHVNRHQYKRQDVNMPCSETFGNYKEKKVGSDTCRLSKWNGQLNRLLTGYKKEKWHLIWQPDVSQIQNKKESFMKRSALSNTATKSCVYYF